MSNTWSKRQVRSPKVYIADSGVLHALLDLTDRTDVMSHPKEGASWEGFVIQQIVQLMHAPLEQCFHWSTHTGAGLDLLVLDGIEALRIRGQALGGTAADAVDAVGGGDAGLGPASRGARGDGAVSAGGAGAGAAGGGVGGDRGGRVNALGQAHPLLGL